MMTARTPASSDTSGSAFPSANSPSRMRVVRNDRGRVGTEQLFDGGDRQSNEALGMLGLRILETDDPLEIRFPLALQVQRPTGMHQVDEFFTLRARMLPSGGNRRFWACPACSGNAAFVVRTRIRSPKRPDLSPVTAWTFRACSGLRPARRRTPWKPGGASKAKRP